MWIIHLFMGIQTSSRGGICRIALRSFKGVEVEPGAVLGISMNSWQIMKKMV